MSEQSKLDEAIATAQQLQDAGEGGWPCGTMLFVAFLGFLAFVALPVIAGMGG